MGGFDSRWKNTFGALEKCVADAVSTPFAEKVEPEKAGRAGIRACNRAGAGQVYQPPHNREKRSHSRSEHEDGQREACKRTKSRDGERNFGRDRDRERDFGRDRDRERGFGRDRDRESGKRWERGCNPAGNSKGKGKGKGTDKGTVRTNERVPSWLKDTKKYTHYNDQCVITLITVAPCV